MLDDDLNTRALAKGTLLWHYTTFTGLKGILLDGVLRASSLTYLNDTEEFRFGIGIALQVLHTELALRLRAYPGFNGPIYGHVVSFFEDRYKPRDVFVASLSTEKDDLSQWRAYGGGGPMFSVGFDPAKLERKADETLFTLEEVQYSRKAIDAELRLALSEPIGTVLSELQKLATSQAPSQVDRWAAELAGELLLLVPRYKHPKFAGEKEWRLIRRQPVLAREPVLDHQFRQSGSLVVPYLAMPVHTVAKQVDMRKSGDYVPSPVAEIMIGPSPHPEELEYAIGELTSRHGIGVKVRNSDVPFRNW